jgi:hypothetical protein
MRLFEAIERTDPSVATHVEDTYSFLNRVDDPAFDRIRQVLNEWFARYEALQPAKAANDVAGRMRSKHALQFDGAFWELYLHEAHVRLGFDVATHPDDVRHPDFVLTKRDERVFLEATITGTNRGSNAAQVYDWINQARDRNYFVGVDIIEAGAATPKRTDVTRPLEAWLGGLADDWSAHREALERGHARELPRCEIAIRDWLLRFEAYPKSAKARAEVSFPTIGVYPGQAAWQGSSAAIVRAKLAAKATHYGELNGPLVIALHDVTPFASRSVMRDALFGLEQPFWQENAGSSNRVSAVLAASDFGMSSPARKTPELWLNPFARHALRPGLLAWPVVGDDAGDAGSFEPAVLFGLPTDWPGKPFRRR